MYEIDAKMIVKGLEKASSDRVVAENTWQDMNKFIDPLRRDIQDKIESGEKLPTDIYDDTAIQSNIILAAGLSGYMTNAAQRWFELRPRNEGLMNDPGVATFFNQSAEIMYSTLANSNFYQQVHNTYIALGSIGTGNLYEEDDAIDDIRFYSREPKEIYAIEDERNVVNMVYRLCEMTAYQVQSKFGDKNLPDNVKECLKHRDFGKKFEFIHYVCPRHARDVGKKDSINMPFASYWVDKQNIKMMSEGGYNEFPFNVPRFYKKSSEVYGYSPGYIVYSDIRMLNKMMETYIKGAEISIYPPWLAESDSIIGTLDLRAASINYQKQPLSQGAAVQSMQPKTNFQVTVDFIERVTGNIKAAYFTDLFLMLTQNANMTATEVIQRTQEKMLMLGPVLGRLQNELLNPVIVRTFNILLRRGKLPPVPESLQGQEFDVVYVSPLAKAQRAVQANDMNTFLTIVSQMSQFAPEIMDKIKSDTVVDKMGRIYSVDPDIIREDDEVDGMRQQRAEAQAQQQKMLMMEQAAGLAKTGTEAMRNEADAKSKLATK